MEGGRWAGQKYSDCRKGVAIQNRRTRHVFWRCSSLFTSRFFTEGVRGTQVRERLIALQRRIPILVSEVDSHRSLRSKMVKRSRILRPKRQNFWSTTLIQNDSVDQGAVSSANLVDRDDWSVGGAAFERGGRLERIRGNLSLASGELEREPERLLEHLVDQ